MSKILVLGMFIILKMRNMYARSAYFIKDIYI